MKTRERPAAPRRDDALVWARDGQDWPNRAASRFVEAAGLAWHVQVMGCGPVLVLVHGTGASTHSWGHLLPRLAQHFTVVAPDLPGHAFTGTPPRDTMTLPGMAADVAALLRALDLAPSLGVGHSAGGAILVQMALDHAIAPAGLIGLNAALLPIGGAAGRIFSPLARLFAATDLMPRLFAWRANERSVIERLIRQTGSKLDADGIEFYRRLAGNPVHAAAALGMMAGWNLWTLERNLPRLGVPLALLVGGSDGTIAPTDAFRIRDLLPGTSVDYLRGLGHLAHEERPDLVATAILRHARTWHVLPDVSAQAGLGG